MPGHTSKAEGLRPVVVIGDVQPDFTFRLAGGADALKASEPVVTGGGTAANVGVALARLGVRVAFIGSVGEDPFGRRVIEELRGEGIDVSAVQWTRESPTPVVFALVAPNGEAFMHRWPPDAGSDWELSPSKLDLGRIEGAAWLHASGICLRRSPSREAVLMAMRHARQSGVRVSFDLNFRREQNSDDPALRAAFAQAIALSDVVLGHADEEFAVLYQTGSADQAIAEAGGGMRTVIARRGSQGVRVEAPGERWSEPAFRAAVVDPVGAGDAFNGGFIAASLEGHSLREAVRWGQAVAALKLERGGARSLPNRADMRSFLATRGQSGG